MAYEGFFEAYTGLEKLAPLVREIGWNHNLVILERSKNPLEREFYLRMTRKFGGPEKCRAGQPRTREIDADEAPRMQTL